MLGIPDDEFMAAVGAYASRQGMVLDFDVLAFVAVKPKLWVSSTEKEKRMVALMPA